MMKFADNLMIRCSCDNLIMPHERIVVCTRCGEEDDVNKIIERWVKGEEERQKKRRKS